ncbi:Major core [Hubei insect virus 2]|uniref:Major core n=1 Tax=Hubei insect virus 2 TaxID=1922898 RepID=UPI00090BAE30|nr:Major core [Hubei insect virus 2]APG79056.1 Major core [Hubei insect virus 2]
MPKKKETISSNITKSITKPDTDIKPEITLKTQQAIPPDDNHGAHNQKSKKLLPTDIRSVKFVNSRKIQISSKIAENTNRGTPAKIGHEDNKLKEMGDLHLVGEKYAKVDTTEYKDESLNTPTENTSIPSTPTAKVIKEQAVIKDLLTEQINNNLLRNDAEKIDYLKTQALLALQHQVMELKNKRASLLQDAIPLREKSSIYDVGLVININNETDLELLADIYDVVNIVENDGPAVFFNLVHEGTPYNYYSNIQNSNIVMDTDFPLISRNREMFQIGTGSVKYVWQPSGWSEKLSDLHTYTDLELISTVTIGGALSRTNEYKKQFYTKMTVMLGIIRNKRPIYSDIKIYRPGNKLSVSGRNLGVNMATIIPNCRPTEDSVELINTRLNGCLPLAVINADSELWARYVYTELVRQGIRTYFGRYDIVTNNKYEIYGRAYCLYDNFSAYIACSAFNEMLNNRLTRGVIAQIYSALKHDETQIQIVSAVDAPEYIKYNPTDSDLNNLLYRMMIDRDVLNYCINTAIEMCRLLKIFKEITNDNIFTEALALKVTAGKASTYMVELASFYVGGDMDQFIKLLTLEAYSSFVKISFRTRALDASYLGIFNLMDVLLLFLIVPKLCWSNSAALGETISSIIAKCFPSEWAAFKHLYGEISRFNGVTWEPTGESSISQIDVLGPGDGTHMQWSILVVNYEGNSQLLNTIFSISNLIQYIGGRIDITRKLNARFPYTSNVRDYNSSWPVIDPNMIGGDENNLSRRMSRVLDYSYELIRLSKRNSQITNIHRDDASISEVFRVMNLRCVIFSRTLSQYANMFHSILVNSFLVCHEWFTPDNYLYAQPIIANFVVNGDVLRSILPMNLIECTLTTSLSTYSLLNIVSIDESEIAHINETKSALGQRNAYVNIPALPTQQLFSSFLRMAYDSKDQCESLKTIQDWFGSAKYTNDIVGFANEINTSARFNIGQMMAKELGCTLFDKFMTVNNVGIGSARNVELRGTWVLGLTNETANLNLNGTMHENRAFGYDLLTVDLHYTRVEQLAYFLTFSHDSPAYTRSHGVIIDKLRGDTTVALQEYELDAEDFNVILVEDDQDLIDGIYRQDIIPDPTYIGSTINADRIHLGPHSYMNVNDFIVNGIRCLITVPDATYLRPNDFDILYKLIIAGVVCLVYRDVYIDFTIEKKTQQMDYYRFEENEATSWIRNELLGCTTGRVLNYIFFDVQLPFRTPHARLLEFNRYVFLVDRTQTNFIVETITDAVEVYEKVPRVIVGDVWNTNTLADNINDDALELVTQHDVRFSNTLPYIRPVILRDIPALEVVGAVAP